MALDRMFAAQSVAGVRPDWRDVLYSSDVADHDGWQVVNADCLPLLAARAVDMALVIPPPSRRRLAQMLADLASISRSGATVYERLTQNGVLVVSPVGVIEDGITLAGGSYSTVSLHIENGQPIVRKRLDTRGEGDPDREGRQRQECAWMRRIPAAVSDLFVPVIGASDGLGKIELVTEFVPGYSLAELVFQKQLDGDELARLLVHIYSELATRVWTRPPIELDVPIDRGDYLGRIKRRLRTIEKSNSGLVEGPLQSLLSAERVVVNGRECEGVGRLLERLARDPCWQPAVTPGLPRMCHGDLILDDVVIDPVAPAGFRLLDPNPSNQHPIYDVFKTMMSLWLKYEFLYFDKFTVTHGLSDEGCVEVEIHIDAPQAEAAYDQAAELFVAFVGDELAGQLGLPPKELRMLLRMGAAINMLAIPVFHLLHHDREPRALAFAATALLHAEQARREMRDRSQDFTHSGLQRRPSTRSL